GTYPSPELSWRTVLMPRSHPLLSVAVALTLLGLAAPRAAAEHPRMHEALHELREAKNDLKTAAHDFGGHRKKALEDLEVAIGQVKAALEAVGEKDTGIPGGKDSYKNYPN